MKALFKLTFYSILLILAFSLSSQKINAQTCSGDYYKYDGTAAPVDLCTTDYFDKNCTYSIGIPFVTLWTGNQCCTGDSGGDLNYDYCDSSSTQIGTSPFYSNSFKCCYNQTTTPDCNAGITCSNIGDCLSSAVNSCALNNGTATSTGCVYTTYSGGGACNQIAAPNQTISCTKDNCNSCSTCVNYVCKPNATNCAVNSDCNDFNFCTYNICSTKTDACGTTYKTCTFNIYVLDGTVWDIPNNYVCCNGTQTTKTSCLTSPIISTSPATNITTTTATLNGSVTGIGEGSPTVTLFWGTANGGEIPTNWQFAGPPSSPSQPQDIAPFSKNISSLIANTTYWFSARAVDSKGNTDWGTPLSFKTSLGEGGTGGTTAPLGTPLYRLTVTGYALVIDSSGAPVDCYEGPLQVSIANIVDYLGLQLNTVQLTDNPSTAGCDDWTMFSFPNGLPSGTYILRTHYSLPGYTPESNVTITVP